MAMTVFCDTVYLTNGAEFYVGGVKDAKHGIEISYRDELGVLWSGRVSGSQARRMAEVLCQVARTHDPDIVS